MKYGYRHLVLITDEILDASYYEGYSVSILLLAVRKTKNEEEKIHSYHELNHVLIPPIDSLFLKRCDTIQFWVVITQIKTRTVRRVVKQLPVEMIQQCSSGNICM
jgi:hypothetical protein